MTEPEVREIFAVLDPKNNGFIEGDVVAQWLKTGHTEKPPRAAGAAPVPAAVPLAEAIVRVCGKNPHQLEWCFLSAEKVRGLAFCVVCGAGRCGALNAWAAHHHMPPLTIPPPPCATLRHTALPPASPSPPPGPSQVSDDAG